MTASWFREIFLIGNGSVAAECAALLSRYSVFFKFLEPEQASSSFLLKRIRAGKVPCELLDNAKLADLAKTVTPTLILSVNNTFLFPPALVANPCITIINYHNSLLPQHRGMHAEAWAIFEGDAQSGVTWHIVDNGIDTGNIICQECVSITEEITSIKLLWRQSIAAIELLEQHLNDILANRYKVFQNDVQKSTSFHYKKDIPGDGYLDTAWPDEKIWRFLRAMDYGPYNNLGLPRLKIGTNVYSWHGYSRKKKKTNVTTNEIVHSNGDIIINNNYSLHNVFKICEN